MKSVLCYYSQIVFSFGFYIEFSYCNMRSYIAMNFNPIQVGSSFIDIVVIEEVEIGEF